MALFLRQKLLILLFTLFLAATVIFAVLHLLPGNAAQVLMGPDADPEAVAALATQLGLDVPAWQRFAGWLVGLLRGDLGHSYAYGEPVLDLLLERLQLTLPLTVLALAISGLLALPIGVYAAAHQGRWPDRVLMGLTQLGLAVPSFWLAMLLIVFFAVRLQWFAAGGFPGWGADEGGGLLPALHALVLPTLSLAAVQTAILARLTRAAVLEHVSADFVRTARAKGLGRHQVLWGHVLRNAMGPILTLLGLQFANLLAGAIVVENVFYLPGLGRLLFQAIANRDLLVVQNGVLLLVTLVIVVNFAIDVLHAWLDPRIRVPERSA
ncbi:ABC transporter permease [Comamonas nitrativorans]|uniref:ABC transporter permease n=1 Tax=Comamonas nitrativorans TaxID=108437 RepID=A0ABV9GZW6_9BURK